MLTRSLAYVRRHHATVLATLAFVSAVGGTSYAAVTLPSASVGTAQLRSGAVTSSKLGGDAITTWTHPKSKAFWLKDFLPQQIPDARIMTFGYNADVAFGQSTAEIIDHAKRLLASLVDKRDEPKVDNMAQERVKKILTLD